MKWKQHGVNQLNILEDFMSAGEFLKRIGVYVKVVGKRALWLVHRAHRRFIGRHHRRITYQQFIHPEDSKKMIDRETVKNVAKLARLVLTDPARHSSDRPPRVTLSPL